MQALRKHKELEDLIGSRGVRAKVPEMPFYEARTSIFGEALDGLSIPESQAHMARAQAHEFAAAALRRGMTGYTDSGLAPRGSPVCMQGHLHQRNLHLL